MFRDDLIDVIADARRLWGNVIAQEKRTLVWLELEADNVAYFHRSDMHDGNMTVIREKPMNDLVQI